MSLIETGDRDRRVYHTQILFPASVQNIALTHAIRGNASVSDRVPVFNHKVDSVVGHRRGDIVTSISGIVVESVEPML